MVDGASTDGTQEEVSSCAHKNMLLVSEPDDGIYDAINKGIEQSSGDIIGLVHSDDFLADAFVLEEVAKSFCDTKIDVVYSDLVYVSHNDASKVLRFWQSGEFTPRRLKNGWMPPHPTIYVRREIYQRLGSYDPNLKISSDYDFILRCLSDPNVTTHYIPRVTYIMRAGGISNRNLSNLKTKLKEDWTVLRRNNVGGIRTLLFKNIGKLSQFFVRPKKEL